MTTSLDQRAPANQWTAPLLGITSNAADRVLLLLMIAFAFLLGCQQLADADFWWQVRSGQWILEQRSVPALDPFTFASADRTWLDLHWLFQVVLAAAYAVGGVPGAILMTSAVCAALVMVVFTLRDRRWPIWLTAACWLPAVALMSRPVCATAGNLLGSLDGPLFDHPRESR